MAILLELRPETEARLKAEANTRGIPMEQYAGTVLEHALGQPSPDPTLGLFAMWAAEDATDDPAEIERRRHECAELLVNLRANRTHFRESCP